MFDSVNIAEDLKEGDIFYAGIDENGNFNGNISTEGFGGLGVDAYHCTVKSDGTITVAYEKTTRVMRPALQGKTLTIPDSINGYSVSELAYNYTGEIPAGFAESGCSKIIIPDTVKTIGNNAFMESFYLEEVEFGSGSQLELIAQEAFRDCRFLKSITIPASVETIGVAAFANTTPRQGRMDADTYSLTAINFAEGSKLKVIGGWAFQLQKSLEAIELPDSLEKLEQCAFLGCSALKKVEIPKNVSEIGGGVFSNADENDKQMSISEINVAKKNKNYKSVDGVVFTKDGKTIVKYPAAKSGKQYEIPDGVNTIVDSAFADCTELTSVTIPESVTTIEEDAFDGSLLTNINGEPGSYAETYANENGYTFNAAASDKEDEPDDTSKPEEDSDTTKPETTEDYKFWYYVDPDMQDVQVGGKFPSDVEVNARLDESSTDKRIVYDINLTRDGKNYEPNGTVEVRFLVPESMRDIDETLIKVYHLKDGKYTNMNAKPDQRGWLEFETDHFSVYVVTTEELDNVDGSDSTSTTDKGTPAKGSPDTGIPEAAAAVGVLALAGAVVLISRKRR